MNNTLNFGIVGSALGFFINIYNQKNNKLLSQIDFHQAFNKAFRTGLISAGIGGIKDLYHILECEEYNSNEQKKFRIWEKGIKVPLLNPYRIRTDKYGNFISYKKFGDRNSVFGWEKDHSKPKSKGGHPTHINNIQPLHWQENAIKGNKYPY